MLTKQNGLLGAVLKSCEGAGEPVFATLRHTQFPRVRELYQNSHTLKEDRAHRGLAHIPMAMEMDIPPRPSVIPIDTRKEAWRVPVLRALIQGDVEVVEQYCRRHPEAIHDTFTRRMTDWQLEPEAYRFFEFQGCTAIFVSASMGHMEMTEWLLANGADPTVGDTKKRLPLECVGESLDEETFDAKADELAEVRALLEAKRRTTKVKLKS